MIKNLSEQKTRLKEALVKEVDNYFEALENSSNQEGFDINKLEQLMLENQRNLKAVMKEANSGMAGNVDAGVKKTAQNAEIF